MNENLSAPPPPPVDAGQTPAAQAVVESNKGARTWAMIAHLSALSGYVVPLGWIIGPLVIWMIKKDEFPFVNRQGKEAINWQLTLLIGFVISIPLAFVCVGFITMVALAIADLIFVIIAGIKANEGVEYKYPWRIQFLK